MGRSCSDSQSAALAGRIKTELVAIERTFAELHDRSFPCKCHGVPCDFLDRSLHLGSGADRTDERTRRWGAFVTFAAVSRHWFDNKTPPPYMPQCPSGETEEDRGQV